MTDSTLARQERAREALAQHGIREGFNLPVLPGYVVAVYPQAVIAAMLAFASTEQSAANMVALNKNGWHLPSVNEGLRVARVANGHSMPGDGDDWVLVPREPTEAMLLAYGDAFRSATTMAPDVEAYRAMLSASPSFPSADDEVESR